MTNRTRDDIVITILKDLENSPMLRTRVMYNARLSYLQLKYYRECLLSMGLIREGSSGWAITEKGKEYLNARMVADKILHS